MNKWSNYGKWRHPELYKKYNQKMKKAYTNRYNNTHTFEVNERGNIQWNGDFKFHRYGYSEDGVHITMVDPFGGPYIFEGLDLEFFGFEGMVVERFIKNEQGYEIIIKK